MAPLIIPALCLVTLIAGGVLFARGATLSRASWQLDGRLGRAGGSETRRQVAMPTMLAARGRDREEIVARLQQAGFSGPGAIQTFLLVRLCVTVVALLLALAASQMIWGNALARPLVLFLAPAITYIMVKRLLLVLAGERQRRIVAEFPFLLDLMLMMLESGISLDQCLHAIARDETTSVPHLNLTLRALVEDLDRGMAYEHALVRWAMRVGTPGARELAALFVQALFQGIELSPALRQFTREFTERRIATAREAMGRISVKMILVMIVFFMPALFIVVGGPPVTALFQMIREMM
jgi:tight adherence protein C